MAIKITCIKKASGDHENPYIAISTMNWMNENTGATGTSTKIGMYDFVTKDKGIAYVKDSRGNKANLIGAVSPKGNKYVKTVEDDVTSDNPLKLPECK
jgi:hypothetical protein